MDRSPVSILRDLIRFDTTNPPGDEAACIAYLRSLLAEAGIETKTVARDPARPNLLARLPGRGEAPPLLLYGHVDVVTTAGQKWTHAPFAGELIDGVVWGRGALDMKGGIAMMVSALLQAREELGELPADVLLAVLSDEEANGEYGARYVVEQHPGYFSGVRYAIGEGGGVSIHIRGRKFYSIMVTEKQFCSLRLTVQGSPGHASIPRRRGAMARLAKVLQQLDARRLPVHVTPSTRDMILALVAGLPLPERFLLRQLLRPALTDRILDWMGSSGELISPSLHNTVSPTIVRGGEKVNVIPAEIELHLDGRLLPGFTPDDLLRELRELLGDDVLMEVTRYDPGPGPPDMGLFDLLADIVRRADPEGIPFPYVLSGVTDARYFSRLGIQTYGFLPMDLPQGLIGTVHAADERVPVESLQFGTRALYTLLQRYPGES
jgi:acetylornithine deacetylase/succinyl-diaminopimelate desuccinylase-like protein